MTMYFGVQKSSRSPSVNRKQLEYLIEFMEINADPITGKVKPSQISDSLANKLNSFGPPIKNTKEWKKVWTDQKYHYKRKLKETQYTCTTKIGSSSSIMGVGSSGVDGGGCGSSGMGSGGGLGRGGDDDDDDEDNDNIPLSIFGERTVRAAGLLASVSGITDKKDFGAKSVTVMENLDLGYLLTATTTPSECNDTDDQSFTGSSNNNNNHKTGIINKSKRSNDCGNDSLMSDDYKAITKKHKFFDEDTTTTQSDGKANELALAFQQLKEINDHMQQMVTLKQQSNCTQREKLEQTKRKWEEEKLLKLRKLKIKEQKLEMDKRIFEIKMNN